MADKVKGLPTPEELKQIQAEAAKANKEFKKAVNK